MTYPTFYGKSGEDAHNFLDELELTLLMSGQHQDDIKLREFSLVLKEESPLLVQDLKHGCQKQLEGP